MCDRPYSFLFVLRMRLAVRMAIGVVLGTCAVVAAAAQQPKLDPAVLRLGVYLAESEHRFSLVVAEERYQQSVDIASDASTVNISRDAPMLPAGHQDRSLRSDYALTRASDKQAWVGYRDTFEVDGRPVRDRDDRLQRTLTDGGTVGAVRIAQESSRFNLGRYVARAQHQRADTGARDVASAQSVAIFVQQGRRRKDRGYAHMAG